MLELMHDGQIVYLKLPVHADLRKFKVGQVFNYDAIRQILQK